MKPEGTYYPRKKRNLITENTFSRGVCLYLNRCPNNGLTRCIAFYSIHSTFRELVNARDDAENLIHISTL
jgi:hypothetical protein